MQTKCMFFSTLLLCAFFHILRGEKKYSGWAYLHLHLPLISSRFSAFASENNPPSFSQSLIFTFSFLLHFNLTLSFISIEAKTFGFRLFIFDWLKCCKCWNSCNPCYCSCFCCCCFFVVLAYLRTLSIGCPFRLFDHSVSYDWSSLTCKHRKKGLFVTSLKWKHNQFYG